MISDIPEALRIASFHQAEAERHGVFDQETFVYLEKLVAASIAVLIESTHVREKIETAGQYALNRVAHDRLYQFSMLKQLSTGAAGLIAQQLEAIILNGASVAIRALRRTDHRRFSPSIDEHLERLQAEGVATRPELAGSVRAYLAQGPRYEQIKGHAEALNRDIEGGIYTDILEKFGSPNYMKRTRQDRVLLDDDMPFEGELTPEEAENVDPDIMEPTD